MGRKKINQNGRLRAIGYLRVSSGEQAASGLGLDAQRARLTAWAAATESDLVAMESDPGASGGIAPERRPGLASALARLRRHEADALVVLNLSRLTRRTADLLALLHAAEREGWRLVSVSESFDSSSASGRLVATMLAATAAWERESGAERTAAALAERTRRGLTAGRHAPYGWRSDATGHLAEDPAEQRVLGRILALEREGLGARRIARQLDGESLTRRDGRPWTFRAVQRVLGTQARRARILEAEAA